MDYGEDTVVLHNSVAYTICLQSVLEKKASIHKNAQTSVITVAVICNSVASLFWTCHHSAGGEYRSVSRLGLYIGKPLCGSEGQFSGNRAQKGSVVANHCDGGESSVVVTTLEETHAGNVLDNDCIR